jgi:galactonate dehydratase
VKITDLKVYVVEVSGRGSADEAWTFVQLDTDEGITGFGEATNYPGNGSLIVADALRRSAEFIVGEDPADINRLWHRLYRKFTYLGPRGLPTAIISGIDIALWDILGKAVGRPIYALLGGKIRDDVRLYANGWFDGCSTPEDYAAAAKRTVALGHTALKCDPFLEMLPFHTGYVDGQISPAGEDLGVDIVAAIRDAVGPAVEILIDAHGHYNVPTAVRIARRLESSAIAWFEEPVPPDSMPALRSVREQVSVPICVGERLYTRFDVAPILEAGLTDFLMADVVWTGGISELLRISTLAEIYHVPISPHNAMGPLQVIAGAHAMLTVPNFYRLEHSLASLDAYRACLNEPLDLAGERLRLTDRPGLGFTLNLEYLKERAVKGFPSP